MPAVPTSTNRGCGTVVVALIGLALVGGIIGKFNDWKSTRAFEQQQEVSAQNAKREAELRKTAFTAKRAELFASANAAWAKRESQKVLDILDPWKAELDPTLAQLHKAAWDAQAPKRKAEEERQAKVAAAAKKVADEAAAAERATITRIGEMPKPSPWDGAYYEVERYLKKVAHDPDSIDMDGCTKAVATAKGWVVRCEYRGKNAFGGLIRQNGLFVIKHGQVVDATNL